MKYEEIEHVSQTDVEAAIARNEPNELSLVILSGTLYEENGTWMEDICAKLTRHHHEEVRGNAVLGFGNLARVQGQLTESKVKSLIEAALRDNSPYVRNQAEAAADDVEFFLQWRLNHS